MSRMKEKTLHELAQEFPNKTYRELEKYREADRQQEAGTCIMGEARKDREEMNPKIKELEEALADALAVNESHQKLNGRLQERVTELEEDNKKLAHQIEDRINKIRKSGM
jgi:chromosome segregation ATPase